VKFRLHVLLLSAFVALPFLTGCVDTYEKSICATPRDFAGFEGLYMASTDNPESLTILKTGEGQYKLIYQNGANGQKATDLTTCQVPAGWMLEFDSAGFGATEKDGKVHLMAHLIQFGQAFSLSGHQVQPLQYQDTYFDTSILARLGIPFDELSSGRDSTGSPFKWSYVKNGQVSNPALAAEALKVRVGQDAPHTLMIKVLK
jgi:hypothetical protein